jgi:hypothetical protein
MTRRIFSMVSVALTNCSRVTSSPRWWSSGQRPIFGIVIVPCTLVIGASAVTGELWEREQYGGDSGRAEHTAGNRRELHACRSDGTGLPVGQQWTGGEVAPLGDAGAGEALPAQ